MSEFEAGKCGTKVKWRNMGGAGLWLRCGQENLACPPCKRILGLEADLAALREKDVLKGLHISAMAARIGTLLEQTRWRDVGVEVPPCKGEYLAIVDGAIENAIYGDFCIWEFAGEQATVTHWMPLPEGPEGE